jgi:solute carrier family 25 phosphate transporter 23/24/25/41
MKKREGTSMREPSTMDDLSREVDVLRFDKERRRSVLRCFLAGGVAGVVSRTVVQPLSVIKSVSQVMEAKSWWASARHVYRTGGARSFWLGNVAGIVRIFPHCGVKFTTYDVLIRLLERSGGTGSVYRARFAVGAVSGGLASLLLYPLDVQKSKVTVFKLSHLAANREVPPMAWVASARELWERGGMMKGVGMSVVGSGLHSGFLFMGYHSVRSWWRPEEGSSPAEYYGSVAAAGVAAGLLAQITYPLDLVRRTALHRGVHAYDTAQMLVSEGGVLGLYRGSVANIVKIAPLFALQFLLYEYLMQTQ